MKKMKWVKPKKQRVNQTKAPTKENVVAKQ